MGTFQPRTDFDWSLHTGRSETPSSVPVRGRPVRPILRPRKGRCSQRAWPSFWQRPEDGSRRNVKCRLVRFGEDMTAKRRRPKNAFLSAAKNRNGRKCEKGEKIRELRRDRGPVKTVRRPALQTDNDMITERQSAGAGRRAA